MFFFYLIINTDSLYTSFELLLQRGVVETRSSQIIQFLSQLNLFELIVGKGYYASYIFNGYSFQAIDNQSLFLILLTGCFSITRTTPSTISSI